MATDPELVDPNITVPAFAPPPRRAVPRVRGSIHLASSIGSMSLVVRAVLAVDIALKIALVPALLNQRSAVQDVVAGRASLHDVDNADHSATLLSHLSIAAFVLAALTYLIWFFQARRNVDHYEPQFQRRSRGWALGGWLPIVSLWIPYQVMTDVLLDSRRSLQRSAGDGWRHSFPLLQAWWAAWLAMNVSVWVSRAQHNDTPHQFENAKLVEVTSALVTIVAGVLAILVVSAITNAQRERQAEWDAELLV
jgi:heme/copper-type cytochrome/quinol oxidase subunit 2